ncbi:YXWGXW repeat-containing protein [Dyella koreensis]|uniref:YXWGXW repeat-containing protein n=1 Tax=Dyella koreensis TaxID=311235 RepID=A0ABW8KA41_9GAMM
MSLLSRSPSRKTPTRLVRGLLAVTLLTAGLASLPQPASAGVFVSVTVAPPPLPVYVQPVIPAPGYIWVPGYWAYDDGDYYWVPGTWVLPPYSGALWTPGYWGWGDGVYVFHTGYWGLHVGFYGGINYGFGYTGIGYGGGYWDHDRFYYNRSVNHVTNNITNVYNKTVINNTTINNTTINRTSFNGGPGGIAARPTPQQLQAQREQHAGPVAAQQQQMAMASQNRAMHASVNHGVPAIAATPRAGVFSGHGVAAAAPVAASARPAAMPGPTHTNAPTSPMNDRGALRSASFAPHNNSNVSHMAQTAPHTAYSPATGPASHAAPHMQPSAYRGETASPRNPYEGGNAFSHGAARPAMHASAPPSAYHPAPPHPQGGGRPAPRAQPAAHAAPHGDHNMH